MRKRLLLGSLWVAMMFAAAGIAKAETVSLKWKGENVEFTSGMATIDGTTIMKSGRDLLVLLGPDEEDGEEISVLPGRSLFTYNGDDYDKITFAVLKDLHMYCYGSKMFQITGRSGKPVTVQFLKPLLSAVTGDVRLILSHFSSEEGYTRPLFDLSYANVYLNEEDALHKVNIKFINNADNGLLFYAYKPSSVHFGYGDYELTSVFGEDHYNFFSEASSGYMTVTGLDALDGYNGNNYYSEPFGAHIKGGTTLVDCGNNQIMGKVTLRYLPSQYAYFDEEKISDWRIVQACDGVTLQIKGAGDLSSLDPATLPWKKYADVITNVEVSSDIMVPMTALPNYAFANMENLKSVRLLDLGEATELPEGLFAECGNLEEVELNASLYSTDQLKKIGGKAFEKCKNLKELALPNSVEEIGESAFNHCENLELTLPENLKKVGIYAFYYSNTLVMPKDMNEDIEADTGIFTSNDATLKFLGTMEEWLARDNSWIMSKWYADSYSSTHIFIDGKEVIDLVIPEGTTELKDYAFKHCTSIETVSFPSTLTTIGYGAFYSCKSLKTVSLPNSLTSMGEYCFNCCYGLTAVHIPEGLTEIPKSAFYDCEALSSIEIPKNITTIGGGAFRYCSSLKDVTIYPWSVTLDGKPFADIAEDATLHVWRTAQMAGMFDGEEWSVFKNTELMNDYSVSLNADPMDLGTITLDIDETKLTSERSANEATVVEDTKITITATPNDHCTFKGWFDSEDQLLFDKASTTVTITDDFYATAKFEKDSFDVKVTIVGATESEMTVKGAGRYGYGDKVVLTFTENDNFTFVSWTYGDVTVTDKTLVIDALTENIDVTITFNPVLYTLTVKTEPAEGGTFTVTGLDGNNQGMFFAEFTITATPAEGYEIAAWKKDEDQVLDNKTTTLNGVLYGDMTITIVFKKKTETGLDDVSATTGEARKVLRNGRVWLVLPDGREFDANGKQVR